MIAIIDYGLGNIRAFANIYRNLKIPHVIARKAQDLEGVDRIILPGVGAFDQAMERLNASGMRESLDHMVLRQKKPVIGICVGMQILGRSSSEGLLPGLGWIDGDVRAMKEDGFHLRGLLPHMGWNQMRINQPSPILEGLGDNPEFYFLHSYYFKCDRPADVFAEVDYGGFFPCVVQAQNVFGVQCHPEKSHHNGVRLLKNFSELEPC